MADFSTAFAILDAVKIGGTILSAGSSIGGGYAQQRAAQQRAQMAEYQAAQLRQAAGQERASSQRSAIEERRRASLIASRALALAGAGGGGVSDPGVANLLADIEGEGAYRAAV